MNELSTSRILRNYLVYVMFFLGTGLISGAIVHLTMDPKRYSLIMACGALLFVVASFLNETVIEKKQLTFARTVRLVVFSLLLSVGIGMMSGGIQHFSDVKDYAAKLIPGGFALSLVAFIVKNEIKMSVQKAGAIIAAFVVILLPLKLTLDYLVEHSDGGGHGGGHGHGTVQTETHHGSTPDPAQPASAQETKPAETKPSAPKATQPSSGHNDGHGGSHH